MKILYLGNFDNPYSDATEKHIKKAFEELGHQVIPINERYFYQERNRILEEIYYEGVDVFFFHKAGLEMYNIPPEDLLELLLHITCKKVFWFFDKVDIREPTFRRQRWIEMITPFVDYGFLTDETWVRRHKYPNLFVLRQGVDGGLGKYKKEYDIPIAFLGALYGKRQHQFMMLKKEFGDDLQVYNNIFGDKLRDFCASAKINIGLLYPADDFYWSSRIYQIIGNGGFLIHPKLEGLKEEGWIEGKHYVGYKTNPELIEKIKYYLKHDDERRKIQKAGYKFCIKNFKYSDRVKQLCQIISK